MYSYEKILKENIPEKKITLSLTCLFMFHEAFHQKYVNSLIFKGKDGKITPLEKLRAIIVCPKDLKM